ncbi:MAG: nucleoside kinase [Eubacterium sp.]|jgi:uridine kinase|nr:nucleoside kinase [Eubacterium sp.]MCH4046766.1 nucleoside kinase [Eubacterium sp.]MCH4079863.1 nucleoside kinase [Eubacterium sp.]MCH4110096.1 nucleoside kinase [Eubacterium sp.]MCI1306482.1 nucleoside kinase [Eubacterium sp.]
MRIRLKTEPNGKYQKIDIQRGTSIEELYKQMKVQLPYTVLGARVDCKYEGMRFQLEHECDVELLDMRTQAACYVYQDSLCMIFITAANEVLDGVQVEVANSLNQGLYIELKGISPVPEETVDKIRARMQEMIDQDIPFKKEFKTSEEISEIIDRQGYMNNTVRLMHEFSRDFRLKLYTLDGYSQFAYGLMAPSTGYMKCFELRPYRYGVLLRFPNSHEPDRLPEYHNQPKLYQAFGEQTRWDRLLDVNYVADLNEQIRAGKSKDLIQVAEALQEKKIAEIADQIRQLKKRIILIAGPSSSGKTTFARRLKVQLKVNGLDAICLSTDDYFKERGETPLDENGDPDYEGFGAIDRDLFTQNMNDLLEGKEVDLPTFNFLTGHKEYGKHKTVLRPGQPVVIEGIHGLNGKLTEGIPDEEKFKIYISPLTQLNVDEHNRVPTTDERLLRRLVRDYQFRGHSASETIQEWPKVRAGEDVNIFPYSGEADVLFNSYLVYEIAVLKKYAEPLLRSVPLDDPAYAEASRMMKFLHFFETIPDDSVIVNNSILREFIGGSIFVS